MQLRKAYLTVVILSVGITQAKGAAFTLEPDDYPDGTTLSHAIPQVTLSVLLADNSPLPFEVTADHDDLGFAPTGEQVFSHEHVPFWVDARRLRMDFGGPVSQLSLSFAGGTNFDTDLGRLEAYNVSGELLETYVTAPMGPGQVEVMSINRPGPDIAYAIAWSVAGDGPYGPFGRLDRLTFDMVPEPASLLLANLTLVWQLAQRRRRWGRHQP